MIALAPFIDRLKEAGYGHVEGLFEFAQLTSVPRNLPACFVIPNIESASGAQRVGAIDQKIVFAFGVVIVMAIPSRNPDAASEQLSAEIKRIKNALFGFRHPEAASGCMLAGGRLLDTDASNVTWMVDFTCHYRERKV